MVNRQLGLLTAVLGVIIVGHFIAIFTPNWLFVSLSDNNGTNTVKTTLGLFQSCKTTDLGSTTCGPTDAPPGGNLEGRLSCSFCFAWINWRVGFFLSFCFC